MHKPIYLNEISFSVANKNCFNAFSSQIYSGSRIAIIGRNGSGKSSLLNILRQTVLPTSGEIIMLPEMDVGYVAQTIEGFCNLSGAQRFHKSLSAALASQPDLLLLDEPTNHLDSDSRKRLLQMLKHFHGTLIVVTHDKALLNNCIDTLWHIDNNKIHQFTGRYDDYQREIERKYAALENAQSSLKRCKMEMHNALMKEQQRAAKSRSKGQKSISQRKWPTIVSQAKAHRAGQTSAKKRSAINKKRQQISAQLSNLHLPDMIVPKFTLSTNSLGSGHLITISAGSVGYEQDHFILNDINLSLAAQQRIAICGKNAAGKSTLLKAILGCEEIITQGEWYLPHHEQIGYLDQHYATLKPEQSLFDHIKALQPAWCDADVRRHLNDFLFKNNEDVMKLACSLSGGEKARACLSMIAAKTPRLLVLDEISNNLDLETKEHVVHVLKSYPGSIILVSHDEDFLQAVGVERVYTVANGALSG